MCPHDKIQQLALSLQHGLLNHYHLHRTIPVSDTRLHTRQHCVLTAHPSKIMPPHNIYNHITDVIIPEEG